MVLAASSEGLVILREDGVTESRPGGGQPDGPPEIGRAPFGDFLSCSGELPGLCNPDVKPGTPLDPAYTQENLALLEAGCRSNLLAHIAIIRRAGIRPVVCLNHFHTDTDEEIEVIRARVAELGCRFAVCDGFAKGGEGAKELAQAVVEAAEDPKPLVHTYDPEATVLEKVEAIAKKVYGAGSVEWSDASKKDYKRICDLGFEKLPVCIAKTPFSLSADPKALGAPKGFALPVQRLILNAGAGFVVVTTGSIMRMPGLPKVPAAMNIDVVDDRITGLA